jgi:hypothetical protein
MNESITKILVNTLNLFHELIEFKDKEIESLQVELKGAYAKLDKAKEAALMKLSKEPYYSEKAKEIIKRKVKDGVVVASNSIHKIKKGFKYEYIGCEETKMTGVLIGIYDGSEYVLYSSDNFEDQN